MRRGRLAAIGVAAVWIAAYRRHERRERVRSGRGRDRLAVRDPAAIRRDLEDRAAAGGPRGLAMEADLRRLAAGAGTTIVVGSGDGSLLELVSATGRAVGVELSHRGAHAAAKERPAPGRWSVQADGSRLPFAAGSADLVAIACAHRTGRPEDLVWEAARVLRTGGRLVLEVPNACRAPSAHPATHALVWLARAFGATHPWAVPGRGWTEPQPISTDLRTDPAGAEVWLPRIEHVPQELVWLVGAAGFRDVRWRTGGGGLPDLPGLRRLGPRLVMQARLGAPPIGGAPPLGIWPGASG
jgi:SAM-dependent methyltransferase